MKLGNISKLLATSPFKDKALEIEAVFDQAGVDTLDKLDNGPRYFGISIVGYSAYQICSYVRAAAIEEAMKPTPTEISPVSIVDLVEGIEEYNRLRDEEE